MAFPHRSNFEPVPPSDRILPEMELDKDHILYNTSQIKSNLLFNMGIDIDQAGFNKDEKGNLRLFEVTPDGEIADPLEDCSVVSGEFLEKIQKGRIFGFPAGEKNPIQMQLVENRLETSKPIEDSPIPVPKKPTAWMRISNTLLGSYKKEIAEYEAAKAKSERCKAELDEIRQSREDILKDEEETYLAEEELRQGEEQDRENDRRLYKLKQIKDPSELYKGELDDMLDDMQEIYGTNPVMHDEFVGSKYTLDEFDALKPYDINQMDVNGPITDRDFMAVSMLNTLSLQSGGQIQPREGGGKDFSSVVGPGRDGAAAAIEDYQNRNPLTLGRMIGQGIHVGESMLQHSTADKKEFVVVNGLMGQGAKLLERDPELMKAAREAGMTEADLEMARGDAKYQEIINKNEWAAERLRAADAGEIDLSDQERRECINTRLAFEVLNQEIAGEQAEQNRSEKAMELDKELAQEASNRSAEYKSKLGEIQKLSEEGAIDETERLRRVEETKGSHDAEERKSDSLSASKYVAALGQPEMFRILGRDDADKTLQSMVDYHLPGKDKMYDLSGPELEKALDSKNLFADKSPYRVPKAPEKGIEPEKQREKQPEIQPEKQFEEKTIEKTRELVLEM